MKKQSINFSWPAELSNFSVDTEQGNFSRCKLKVFYKGETADHRFFSDDFASELVNTLPYTPVVSYFDEEKDDFVGHATEQQIYGIVDPLSEHSFELDEEGKEWCVCDVVLYTKRPDLVGKIAQKIVGHKQSLELDPSSVKYVINYDEKKHFKNIEFTAGKFVGISVLGNDQKPAFTGSEFFSYNEDFENKMQLLREYCEKRESKNGQTQNGGEKMNLQEFMQLSWGEISLKVDEAICHEYERDAYTYIVDMFDNKAIAKFWYYIDGSQKLMSIDYSIAEDGSVQLGEIYEVRVTYERVDNAPANYQAEADIEQPVEETPVIEEVPSVENAEEQPKIAEEEQSIDDAGSNNADAQDNGNSFGTQNTESENSENVPTEEGTNFETNESADPAQVSNVESTPVEEKVSVENEQTSDPKEDSSSTSFTESERAEFEALEREEKITLVNSYKDDLSEEEIINFLSNVDSYDKAALELELLKAYKNNAQKTKPMRAFTFAPVNNVKTQDSLDSFVKKHLGK